MGHSAETVESFEAINAQVKAMKEIINKVIEATYISAGYYLSKSQASSILNIPTATLQYHIGKGHVDTIHFPGLGHLIRERDVNSFKRELDKYHPGRPTIYKKVK